MTSQQQQQQQQNQLRVVEEDEVLELLENTDDTVTDALSPLAPHHRNQNQEGLSSSDEEESLEGAPSDNEFLESDDDDEEEEGVDKEEESKKIENKIQGKAEKHDHSDEEHNQSLSILDLDHIQPQIHSTSIRSTPLHRSGHSRHPATSSSNTPPSTISASNHLSPSPSRNPGHSQHTRNHSHNRSSLLSMSHASNSSLRRRMSPRRSISRPDAIQQLELMASFASSERSLLVPTLSSSHVAADQDLPPQPMSLRRRSSIQKPPKDPKLLQNKVLDDFDQRGETTKSEENDEENTNDRDKYSEHEQRRENNSREIAEHLYDSHNHDSCFNSDLQPRRPPQRQKSTSS